MNWSLVLCALFMVSGLTAQESGYLTETWEMNAAETGRSQPDPGEVVLCLQMHAMVPPAVVLEAELTASQIFEDIGVRLHWSCKAPVTCNETQYHNVLVRVQDHTPEFERADALAIALPFAHSGVRITVFYDRFNPALVRLAGSTALLLGHTLAHELGHVLAGNNGHSRVGLMRAIWDDGDFLSMQSRSLGFTPEFIRSIRSSITGHTGPLYGSSSFFLNRIFNASATP